MLNNASNFDFKKSDSPERSRRDTRRNVLARKAAFLTDGLTVRASAFALVAFLLPGEGNAADLETAFRKVCASQAVKSERLQQACAENAMPKPLKDGTRFAARGYGAEVNALVANLRFFEGK